MPGRERFTIRQGDDVLEFEAGGETSPCAWMDWALAPGARDLLRGRGGLRATPVTSGTLRLGPAVREYPVGQDGPGDVDSGPLPLGVSLSATAVTLGAAAVQGDGRLAGALANYGELIGVPVSTPWSKRYAAGVLPIGDAFLAWSKTARPWVAAQPAPLPAAVGPQWRLPFLALLALAVLLSWLPVARAVTGSRRR